VDGGQNQTPHALSPEAEASQKAKKRKRSKVNELLSLAEVVDNRCFGMGMVERLSKQSLIPLWQGTG